MADAPWIPVALTLSGAYLAWFGVHYWRSDIKWPSDPVKATLTGKPLPSGTRTSPAHPVDRSTAASTPAPATVVSNTSVLGKQDLISLWTSNGGDPSTANVAAAVALAESSGRPDATSPNPDGGTNVGLWQLDTRGVGSGYSVAQLSDPGTNARVTILGSGNGTRWGPWQTYDQGTYRQFL